MVGHGLTWTNEDMRQGQSLVFLSLHLDTQGQEGT